MRAFFLCSLGVGMGLQLGWARHGGAAKRRWGRLGDGWLVDWCVGAGLGRSFAQKQSRKV